MGATRIGMRQPALVLCLAAWPAIAGPERPWHVSDDGALRACLQFAEPALLDSLPYASPEIPRALRALLDPIVTGTDRRAVEVAINAADEGFDTRMAGAPWQVHYVRGLLRCERVWLWWHILDAYLDERGLAREDRYEPTMKQVRAQLARAGADFGAALPRAGAARGSLTRLANAAMKLTNDEVLGDEGGLADLIAMIRQEPRADDLSDLAARALLLEGRTRYRAGDRRKARELWRSAADTAASASVAAQARAHVDLAPRAALPALPHAAAFLPLAMQRPTATPEIVLHIESVGEASPTLCGALELTIGDRRIEIAVHELPCAIPIPLRDLAAGDHPAHAELRYRAEPGAPKRRLRTNALDVRVLR